MNELHAVFEFLVAGHDRGLCDAQRCFFTDALDHQRIGESLDRFHGPLHRIDDELGRQDAVIGQDLFAQRLVVGKHQAARVASGVRLPQQFQKADNVLVVQRDAVKFFEHVEGDVRLPLLDLLADLAEVVENAQRTHVVPHFAERGDDVELALPFENLLVGVPLKAIRRHEVRVHQHQDAHLLEGAAAVASLWSQGYPMMSAMNVIHRLHRHQAPRRRAGPTRPAGRAADSIRCSARSSRRAPGQ